MTGQDVRTDNDHDNDEELSSSAATFNLRPLTSTYGNRNVPTDFVDDNIVPVIHGARINGVLEEEDEEGNTKNRSGHSISAHGGLMRTMRAVQQSRDFLNAADIITKRIFELAKTKPEKHHEDSFSNVRIASPTSSHAFNAVAGTEKTAAERGFMNFSPVRNHIVNTRQSNTIRGADGRLVTLGIRADGRTITHDDGAACLSNAAIVVKDKNGNDVLENNTRITLGRRIGIARENAEEGIRDFFYRATGQKAADDLSAAEALAYGPGGKPHADNDNTNETSAQSDSPARTGRQSHRQSERTSSQESSESRHSNHPARQTARAAVHHAGDAVEAVAGREVRQAVGRTARTAFHAAADTVDNARQVAQSAVHDVSRNVNGALANADKWRRSIDLTPWN